MVFVVYSYGTNKQLAVIEVGISIQKYVQTIEVEDFVEKN